MFQLWPGTGGVSDGAGRRVGTSPCVIARQLIRAEVLQVKAPSHVKLTRRGREVGEYVMTESNY